MIYSNYSYIPKKRINLYKLIPWVGTCLQITGAVLVSSKFLSTGFIFFTVGSFIWLCIAMYREDKPLAFLELIFLCTNIIGLYNYTF